MDGCVNLENAKAKVAQRRRRAQPAKALAILGAALDELDSLKK